MRGVKGSIIMDYTVSNQLLSVYYQYFPFNFSPLAVFSDQIMALIVCGSLFISQIAHFLFSL